MQISENKRAMALKISAKRRIRVLNELEIKLSALKNLLVCLLALKDTKNPLLDKVRVTTFTPPPPSDRHHKPLISSFALIKIEQKNAINGWLTYPLLQLERPCAAAKVDVHGELAAHYLECHEVAHTADDIVGRGSNIQQRSISCLRLERHGEVRIAASLDSRVPRPALAIERGRQALAIGTKEAGVVGGAVALVAVVGVRARPAIQTWF